jgi:hypothetical protein
VDGFRHLSQTGTHHLDPAFILGRPVSRDDPAGLGSQCGRHGRQVILKLWCIGIVDLLQAGGVISRGLDRKQFTSVGGKSLTPRPEIAQVHIYLYIKYQHEILNNQIFPYPTSSFPTYS